MKLNKVIDAIEQLAPPELAEDWDNTGLLVESLKPRTVTKILLTIDLTEPVLKEAVQKGAELVIAYHPTLFDPLTRLTTNDSISRVLMGLMSERIALYSPHTALDAVDGGVNDWLADGLGASSRVSILPSSVDELTVDARVGQGRILTLEKAATLNTIVQRVKKHLGLQGVKIALAERHKASSAKVKTIALCAGAGASVLNGVETDLYLTGEMKHHDVLAAVAGGHSVILCDHTNTERGYLPVFARRLRKALGASVKVLVSRKDCEPLTWK